MSFMFGNNDTYSKSGNNTFVNGRKGSSTLTNSGNMSFDTSGHSMTNSGGMSFTSSGHTITQSGNRYFLNGKTYTRSGNMLFSSDGKTWAGDMTDSDTRNIIFNENN